MCKSKFINTQNDFNYKNIINIKRTIKQFVHQFHNKEVSSLLNSFLKFTKTIKVK